MSSLSAHTRQSAGHDHLAFHPACPTCRDSRLAGRIIDHPLVPAKAKGGLTLAVVASSVVLAGTKVTLSAYAQTASDETTPMVSPKQLDKGLADPSDGDPAAKPKDAPRNEVTVQPGDSLWTIAHEELGGSPSNAKIAGEVNRLWSLNAKSIATGDRDLIYPGQRLKLR